MCLNKQKNKSGNLYTKINKTESGPQIDTEKMQSICAN